MKYHDRQIISMKKINNTEYAVATVDLKSSDEKVTAELENK